MLQSTIESFGGVVCKFMGDGAMALFGAPTAHEDDPERAVKAALGIVELLANHDSTLRVRVGVTTGEALVRLGSAHNVDAVGDVVNTAARLETAAPVGGVLVDEATYRATSRVIAYQGVEQLAAKGKSEPLSVWRAVETHAVVPEQPGTDRPPLVGRDRECHAMVAALQGCLCGPATRIVSVIGEPGIAKTRLVHELYAFAAALPEPITWRRGRSLAYGEGVAFWAVGEMVKGQAGILESDDVNVAGSKLAGAVDAVIADQHDRTWVDQHLRPLIGLERTAAGGYEGGRVEAFAAWRKFFEALAAAGPTVLVFEDVHWADDALLDFIDALADAASRVPLLIVCTARPDLPERRTGWPRHRPNGTVLILEPLSSHDTARLVGQFLGRAPLPADAARSLLERVEGNPLYAQEYLLMLQDRGLLTRESHRWVLSPGYEGLPESIHGIIAARLDTLSTEERLLIQDASVVGRTAWVGAVCALSPRGAEETDELLGGVQRKQLVHRLHPSSIRGETEFRFAHALIRDVAYSQIPRRERAAKHESAAGWIERLSGNRDDKAELLADHYHHALTLRGQLGENTTAVSTKARQAFTEAARQAAAVHAHVAAVRHYRAALELTPADDPHRSQLLLGECTELFEAGSADEQTLKNTLDAQVADESWEAAARVERMLFYWYQERVGEGQAADAHLAQGAEYARRIPPSDVMCQIASDQALRLAVSGRARQAFELTDRLIPLATESNLPVGRALLLQWRGSARVMLGDPEGTIDMREAADTLAEHAHPGTPGAYGNLAEPVRDLGDIASADQVYAVAHEWAVRLESALYLDWIVAMMADQAYHAGRWDDSSALLARIDTINLYDAAEAQVTGCRLQLGRGDIPSALREATAIAEYATGIGNDAMLYCGLSLQARCQVATGHTADALVPCDRFLDRWHESGGTIGGVIELCQIADVLAGAGQHQRLQAAAQLVPVASRWREGLMATADGRYADAAVVYEQIGSRPIAADAHLLAARQSLLDRRHADAVLHAHAVISFAEHAGATLYRERASAIVDSAR
jgi:hypothetical protein